MEKLQVIDSETLLNTPFPKQFFVVEGLIPQGLSVFCGQSKIGKSWLMLYMGLQVSQGLPVMGCNTNKCDVLYLCLEDTYPRLRDRVYKLSDTGSSNLYLTIMAGGIGTGIEEQIEDFLTDYPETRFIMIDTLQKIRTNGKPTSKQGIYGDDYDDISSIKAIADKHIERVGTISPALARPLDNGKYELISGHRRMAACKAVGLETMPVIVRDMSDDEAVITMADANLQRETILPSEKAFAYKMKLEALKHQGRTSRQVVGKSESADMVSNTESGRQVQRFIRLTELIPQLLEMVDEKKIAFNIGVELSYLQKDEQKDLLDTIESEDCTPSLSQAQRMKKLSQSGELNMDVIFAIMTEEKANQKEQVRFMEEDIRKYFPRNYTKADMQKTIISLLEKWQKQRERNRRDER